MPVFAEIGDESINPCNVEDVIEEVVTKKITEEGASGGLGASSTETVTIVAIYMKSGKKIEAEGAPKAEIVRVLNEALNTSIFVKPEADK